jgi:hypothetical protein
METAEQPSDLARLPVFVWCEGIRSARQLLLHERELWALTPHIFAVNAKPDLVANIGRALAEGLLALAP